MTILTAAQRQILDGLLAELAADGRCKTFWLCAAVRAENERLGKLDAAAEPDPCDDDAEIAAALDARGA